MAEPLKIPVFYGSYRRDRMGIRAAHFTVKRLEALGHKPELVDAKAVGLPMLDRMYKEYPKGEAPAAMEALAATLRAADAFVIVAGEYNHGVQPGLKNLLDHFLNAYFWRPSGIVCYSQGVFGGVRAMVSWRASLAEMGMPSISSIFPVARVQKTLDEAGEPTAEAHGGLEPSFAKFAADLAWWAEAARWRRGQGDAPY